MIFRARLEANQKTRDLKLSGLRALPANIATSYVERIWPSVLAEDPQRLGQGGRKVGVTDQLAHFRMWLISAVSASHRLGPL